jgi:hypothetical protein
MHQLERNNRAHLLQLDLDPDQTRSVTSTPRSDTIGNYDSPIKHDRLLQLPDQTRSVPSTPQSDIKYNTTQHAWDTSWRDYFQHRRLFLDDAVGVHQLRLLRA